jgi:hypothetical protein
MLTDTGIDLLIEFTDKTESAIVTRAMTDSALTGLEKMLKTWANNKTKANEKLILEKFAVDVSDGKDY